MLNRRIVEPQEGLVLVKDPCLVWVPLAGGQVCAVCAHDWDLDGDEARFFVEVEAASGEGLLEIASFPTELLGPRKVVDDALSVRKHALRSPAGTKVIVFALDYWSVKTRDGAVFRVYTMGASLEGPHAEFSMIVQGSPPGSRPIEVDTLRFPVACLSEDFDVVRNW